MQLALKQSKYWIHVIITIMLMLSGRYFPTIGEITPFGMEIIGIFLGMIYGWTFCNRIWPSILTVLLLGMSGYFTVNEMFAAGAGENLVLFLFFLYIFCGAIDDSGLMEVVGQYIVSLKIAQGKPYMLMFLCIFAAWLLGGLVSCAASALLMWKVFYEICEYLGYKKGEKYVSLVVIGIFYAAMIGSAFLPFKPYGYMVIGMHESLLGESIAFLPYTILDICVTFVNIVVYVVLCRFVFRPEVSYNVAEIQRPSRLTSRQVKVLAIFIFLIIAFFLPDVLPTHWRLTTFFDQMGNTGIMIGAVMISMLLQDQGRPILDVKSAVQRSMSWDIYFICFAVLPLADIISSDATGISGFLVENLSGIFSGHSAAIFCLMVIGIGGIMANIIGNMVTPVIIILIMAPFARELGINPMILTSLMTIVMMNSLILPSGSSVTGLLLSNDWVKNSEVYRYGVVIVPITILVTTAVGVPLGMLLFS